MKHLAIILILPLCACTTGQPIPPVAPTITIIGTTWGELNAAGLPPTALLNVGAALDDQACGAWFDQQVLASEQTRLGQSALGSGAAGAALAGGPAGLAAAGALGLVSSFLGSAQSNSPTGGNPVMAYGLMQRERQAWLAAAPAPATADVAWSYLQNYHSFCSLSGIQWALAQAVMTTPVTAVPVTSPVAPTPPDGPIVTPSTKHAHVARPRAAQSFWQQNPPTFALSPSGLAVPPRICVGCGR